MPNNPSFFSALPTCLLIGFTTEHGFILRVCPASLKSAWFWGYQKQQPQEVPFPEENFKLHLLSFLCLPKCKL